jgi:diguanylate cyclase (GGDEF)-like protein/PAS domain S-box-containing protein
VGWATDSIERSGLDTVVDQAADGIVITDKSGKILFVNPAFTSMTGYSNIEAVGQCPRVLRSRRQSPAFYEELWGTIQSGKIWQGEVINRRKDGTTYHEEMRIAPVRDTNGEISGYIAIKRDITERMRAMQALAESEARFCRLFEESGAVMLLVEPLTRGIISANSAASSYYGYSRESMVGMPMSQINILPHEDIGPEKRRAFGEERHFFSYLNRLSSGEERSVEVYTAPVAVDGRSLLFYIVHDVTDRKRAQEALRVSEERYRVAFQTSLDVISISRVNDGTYVEVNDAFVNTMGYERKEVIGRSALDLDVWVDSGDRLSLVELMRHKSSCRDVEAQFRRKNGEVFSGLFSVSLIEIDGSPCLLSALRDVSDSKVAEKEIKTLAFFDPLTGLPNRRLLLDELGKTLAPTLRKSRKRALLFVDLDDFKTVNDTLGHKTGDLMLKEIALRLKACLRDGDTVAHQGGDEFVVLLEDLSESSENATTQARAVAEKILAVVGQPFHLAAHECRITSCIGITVFGNDSENSRDALQQADIAVHQAKLTGRNSMHCFAPAMQTAVNARASMVQDLRIAISRNQFLIYYQPQVDRGHLVGVEALLRWKHPTRGIVPPNEFISLAEETGMILPLGNWVLETACKQIAGWATGEETAHIAVSVNISAHQFRQPNFVEQILASLETTGANPKKLKLELTESILVKSIEDVIAKMSRLKYYGVRFSVDDFGTGYSSLTYLKRLPLDQLKIDRSFVHDILTDVGSGAIAQSIISLSKAMGLSVIAEGVEIEEQREILVRMGCHSFQGYLFSRPLPVEEFELLIASQNTWHAKYPSKSDDSYCHSVLM